MVAARRLRADAGVDRSGRRVLGLPVRRGPSQRLEIRLEIQVRVYDEQQPFKKSIGWRKSPEAELEDTKETGFHSCFAAHTRDFAEYNGYWLANKMTAHGAIAEYWAAREKSSGARPLTAAQVRSHRPRR